MSMASLFRLRRTEPALARPYRAPLYPAAPAFALAMAAICFVALVIYNPLIFAIFLGVMVLAVLAATRLATPDTRVGTPAYDPAI
jgi:ethanolamine permease